MELLSREKIDSFAAMRREELGLMVQSLKEMGEARQVVNLSDTVIELIEHMTHKMVFGHSKIERIQLKALTRGVELGRSFQYSGLRALARGCKNFMWLMLYIIMWYLFKYLSIMI